MQKLISKDHEFTIPHIEVKQKKANNYERHTIYGTFTRSGPVFPKSRSQNHAASRNTLFPHVKSV